jgi:membrane protein required for colicin V production
VGVILAGNYAGPLADKLTFISDPRAANIAAFVFIMVAVMIAAGLLAFLLKKVADIVLLGWINRLGGAVLGLLLGLVFIAAILTMYVKYMGLNGTIEDSWMAVFLLDKFPIVLGFLPAQFDSVRNFLN